MTLDREDILTRKDWLKPIKIEKETERITGYITYMQHSNNILKIVIYTPTNQRMKGYIHIPELLQMLNKQTAYAHIRRKPNKLWSQTK